jgi:hypothetical protein
MTSLSPDYVGSGFWDNIWGRITGNPTANKQDAPPPHPPPPVPPSPALAVPTPTLPPLSVLKKMADISYEKVVQPNTIPEGYTLVQHNDTLKFFKSNTSPMFVVGIRGTADARDLRADALILLNKAEGSARYKEDLETLKQFQQKYPKSQYTYYGVGHSYGGFELDGFIKAGLIEKGVSYNPAIAQEDFKNADLSNKNYRIYSSGDPLYKLMGQFDAPKEVRNPAPQSWTERLAGLIPVDGIGYNSYKQHSLDNPIFSGGRRWGNLFGGDRKYECPPVKMLRRLPKKTFDTLYTMLNDISLQPHRGLTRKGFNTGSSAVFGLTSVRRIEKGENRIRISAFTKKYPNIAKEIFRIGKQICPFPFKSVYVNHNVKTPKHRDTGNTDLAMIVSFGEYSGGLLMVDGKPADTYLRPVIFNGAECEHYNTGEIKGNKYSLVFYNNLKGSKGDVADPHNTIKEMARDIPVPEEKKKGAGNVVPYADSPFFHLKGSAVPANPGLYEKAKGIVYQQYKKPSAYRSGALVKKYKEMGGKYRAERGKKKPLKRWFEEDWEDIGGKDYPVYRPTKRITADTPLTASEIDPEDAKEQIERKQKIKGAKNLPPFIPK